VVAFIHKPVEFNSLQAAVTKALKEKEAHD